MLFLVKRKIFHFVQLEGFALETDQHRQHALLLAVKAGHVSVTQNIRRMTMERLQADAQTDFMEQSTPLQQV